LAEISRNKGNNNAEAILTLAEFLQFAKNNPGVGIYIDVQVCGTDPYLLR